MNIGHARYEPEATQPPSLATIAREWGRIGVIGFGGPPAHIALLRQLCVQRRAWLSATEFSDGVATTNLLPGPASTQLAIWCAWRVRRAPGAIVGGLCFIVPGLIAILGLAALFLADHPPDAVRGAAAGAGAAVAAVAVRAAYELMPASWRRAPAHRRWCAYLVAGVVAALFAGAYVVLVLVAAGAIEAMARHRGTASPRGGVPSRGDVVRAVPVLAPVAATGGWGALAWVAIKVGALSYGGGFVIIPLMRSDAVDHHHWMSNPQFLNAVALGQITPGPVVHTVAVVGYAAAGLGGGIGAAAIAFAPSFLFILGGARHFDRLRANSNVRAFLDGAGPAAIGAIAGSAVLLVHGVEHGWQFALLAAAAIWCVLLRRSVVTGLLGSAVVGLLIGAFHGPVG